MSVLPAVNRAITREFLVERGPTCMVHPNSGTRFAWDLACMAFLGYDIIAIPLVQGFDVPDNLPLLCMTWLTVLFWTQDMLASCLTGYHNGSKIVMSLRPVLLRYFRTWFLLDTLLVLTDWVIVISTELNRVGKDGTATMTKLGRSLRTLRFIRTLRLVRLLKLRRIVHAIQDHINTETVALTFRIVWIVSSLVVANHLVACTWYAIGNSAKPDAKSWVNRYFVLDRDVTYGEFEEFGWRYTTALHWSLTQFTPATMEVHPQNVGERSFAVVVLIFAMVCFSSFVSILTASFAELRKIQSNRSRQFWLLRRYMRDWGVSRETRLRIQRYLEYAFDRQSKRVQEKEVQLLELLSEPLREEIKYETSSNHLAVHPLFSACGEKCRCFSRASKARLYAKHDMVFSCGQQGVGMYFLSSGLLKYTLYQVLSHANTTKSMAGGEEEDMVLEGQWVSEAALWATWLHLGDLQALQVTHVVIIDAQVFGECISMNTPLYVVIRMYAQEFVKQLKEVAHTELTDMAHWLFSAEDVMQEAGVTRITQVRDSTAQHDEDIAAAYQAKLKKAFNRTKTVLGFRD
jgi:hypothetical protein